MSKLIPLAKKDNQLNNKQRIAKSNPMPSSNKLKADLKSGSSECLKYKPSKEDHKNITKNADNLELILLKTIDDKSEALKDNTVNINLKQKNNEELKVLLEDTVVHKKKLNTATTAK